MSEEYSDCFYCGGQVNVQFLPREIRWRGKLFVFEGVPMGVCSQCGEKFLKPYVSKAIDRALKSRKKPDRTIQVPVYQYDSVVA